jgi:hypothetical protein
VPRGLSRGGLIASLFSHRWTPIPAPSHQICRCSGTITLRTISPRAYPGLRSGGVDGQMGWEASKSTSKFGSVGTLRRNLIVLAVAIVVGAVITAIPTSSAEAATDNVTNCSSSATAPGSLPFEIANAASGDSIFFSVDCPSASPITLTSTIDINADLTIEGLGAENTVISGNNVVSVFDIASGVTATISGITVADGRSSTTQGGGGILNLGTLMLTADAVTANASTVQGAGISNLGTLSITASTLSDNSTSDPDIAQDDGGAIYSDGSASVLDSTIANNSTGEEGGGIAALGTLTVSGSTISGNGANFGGGLFSSGQLDLTNSRVLSNSSNFGGGVYVGGSGSLSDSAISDNNATYEGGGLFDTPGAGLTVSEVELSNNASNDGGGIYNSADGSLVLTESTLSGNDVEASGGGIDNARGGPDDNEGGTIVVSNSTIADNSAEWGGGINNDYFASATITHGTIVDNRATNFGAGLWDDGSASIAATIIAENSVAMLTPHYLRTNCYINTALNDEGFNLDDDGSCQFSSGATSDGSLGLDPNGLAYNGGTTQTPTQTVALDLGSVAIRAIDNSLLCASASQQGISRPSPCDIGAYEYTLASQSQTVVFTSTPSDEYVGKVGYTVSAAATSGLPVSFSVTGGSSVCSIAGSIVSFIAAGNCTIAADQPGDDQYLPASLALQSFTVAPVPRAIVSANRATATTGVPFAFTVATLGTPVPTITCKGTLPRGLRFADHDDGTATISGTAVTKGTAHLSIRATFGTGKGRYLVSQGFILTVKSK